jgi:hypothetical protein
MQYCVCFSICIVFILFPQSLAPNPQRCTELVEVSPIPNPQSPIPSPQRCTELAEVSPIPNPQSPMIDNNIRTLRKAGIGQWCA